MSTFLSQIVGMRSGEGGELMQEGSTKSPGERAPTSGQWEIVRDGKGTGIERTVTRGEPLPPTPKPGDKYRLADPTKH